MIIWLNGTFGVGKTTTATLLAKSLPDARVFDSELVGHMLRPVLEDDPVHDFQQWPPWRALVVETAVQVFDYVRGTIVIPQSVLDDRCWFDISSGFKKAGVPVRHFVLHADRESITRRIIEDTENTLARQWRLDHLQRYEAALPWLSRKGQVIDTARRTPEETRALISQIALS